MIPTKNDSTTPDDKNRKAGSFSSKQDERGHDGSGRYAKDEDKDRHRNTTSSPDPSVNRDNVICSGPFDEDIDRDPDDSYEESDARLSPSDKDSDTGWRFIEDNIDPSSRGW